MEDQVPERMRYKQVLHNNWGTTIQCGKCGKWLAEVHEGVLVISHEAKDGTHVEMVKLSKLIGR